MQKYSFPTKKGCLLTALLLLVLKSRKELKMRLFLFILLLSIHATCFAAPLPDKDNSKPIIKSNKHTFMPIKEVAPQSRYDEYGHPLYTFNHKHLGVKYKLRPFIHHGRKYYECPQCHSARQCGHYGELAKILKMRNIIRNKK